MYRLFQIATLLAYSDCVELYWKMSSNESVAGDGSDRASGCSEKAGGGDGSFSFAPKTRYCVVKGCKARLALQVYDPTPSV